LKNLDITHPDANTIFSGFFTCEKKLKSILEFIDLSKDKNYKQINESILQSARKFFNLNFKNINRMNYGHFARFVSEKCERDRIRRFKKTKSVDVKIGSRWFDTSDGFNFCCYGVNPYKEEIKKATEKARFYRRAGLSSFSKSVLESIQRVESYFGFQRLNISDGLIILAKVHGYSLLDDAIQKSECLFEPTLVPIWDLEVPLPKKLDEVIGKTETFFKGGLPLFDQIFVAFPFGEYEKTPVRTSKQAPKKEPKLFTNSEDLSQKEIYSYLIKHEKVNPIIFGERQGKSYFISSWR
jgi:hypothetical protein